MCHKMNCQWPDAYLVGRQREGRELRLAADQMAQHCQMLRQLRSDRLLALS